MFDKNPCRHLTKNEFLFVSALLTGCFYSYVVASLLEAILYGLYYQMNVCTLRRIYRVPVELEVER